MDLVVVYHRSYDTVMMILFIAFILHGLDKSAHWALTTRQRNALVMVFTMTLVPLLFFTIFSLFVSENALTIIERQTREQYHAVITLTLTLSLFGSLWLYGRLEQPSAKIFDAQRL